MPLLWLVVAMVALAIEAVATHFLLFFVAVAALLAAALAAWSAPLQTQIIVFSLSCLGLPLLFRRRLLRRFAGRGVPSRAEGLLGLPAVVTETIDPQSATGRVQANGQDWKAKSTTRIESGSIATVVGADGIELLVEPTIAPQPETPTT